MSEDLLRGANLQPGETQTPPKRMVLTVPALYAVPEDSPLSGTARKPATSDEVLLSANPQLAARKELAAGTLLVVPPESEGRP